MQACWTSYVWASGWSGDPWRERGSRRERPLRRPWPYRTHWTARRKRRYWPSRRVGECNPLGKLRVCMGHRANRLFSGINKTLIRRLPFERLYLVHFWLCVTRCSYRFLHGTSNKAAPGRFAVLFLLNASHSRSSRHNRRSERKGDGDEETDRDTWACLELCGAAKTPPCVTDRLHILYAVTTVTQHWQQRWRPVLKAEMWGPRRPVFPIVNGWSLGTFSQCSWAWFTSHS